MRSFRTLTLSLFMFAVWIIAIPAISNADAERYEVDVAHTEVGFVVTHMMINKVRGKFNSFTGVLWIDEEDMSKSRLEGSVNAASVDTDHKKRDKHLRSEDFFWVDKYPKITFETDRVEIKGKQNILVGTLTMRGITRSVRIPFELTGKIKDPWGNIRIGFEGRTKIDRKDFGINWNKTLDTGGVVVGDEVEIVLVGEAVKKPH